MRAIVDVHFPGLKKELLGAALKTFYDVRNLPGLKKKRARANCSTGSKLLVARTSHSRRCKAGTTRWRCRHCGRAAEERTGRDAVREARLHATSQPLKTMAWPAPVELRGDHAALLPLRPEHEAGWSTPCATASSGACGTRACPRPQAWRPRSSAACSCRPPAACCRFTVFDESTPGRGRVVA